MNTSETELTEVVLYGTIIMRDKESRDIGVMIIDRCSFRWNGGINISREYTV